MMDFSFSVNELFKDELTCLDGRMEACPSEGGVDRTREGLAQFQKKLFEIIDQMGQASAKAQGLDSPITSGIKLKGSDHRLYILKNSSGNSGKGCIVGILKVGKKNLFLYDKSKVQHEVQPLCVLDFYVHESRQRMGCGRRLFDFMLKREGVPVAHFAINRPSPKLLSFMAKHYNLRVTIPQAYNFVIFDGFFSNRLGSNCTRGPGERSNTNIRMSSPENIHSGQTRSTFQYTDDVIARNALNNWMSPNSSRQSDRHMGAGHMKYSRHGFIPSSRGHLRPGSTRNGIFQEPTPLSNNMEHSQINNFFSNNAVYDASWSLAQKHPNNGGLTPSQQKYIRESNPPLLQRDGPPANYKEMLNLHQRYQQRNGHLTIPARTADVSALTPSSAQFAKFSSAGQDSSAFDRQTPDNASWTVMSVLRDQKNALVSPGNPKSHGWW